MECVEDRDVLARSSRVSFGTRKRQGWISALAHTEADIAKLQNKTLIVHGRKGRVILAF